MTFRCGKCEKVSEPGESAIRVAIGSKVVTYPFRPKANRNDSDDPGGIGTAITRERLVCAACVAP